MSSLYLFFFLLLILIIIPSFISAYPDGAGACFGTGYTTDLSTFKSNHGNALFSDTTNGNYKFIYHIPPNRHGTTEYTPGCSYTISICRTPYTVTVPSSSTLSTTDKNKVIDAASKGSTSGLLLLSKGGTTDSSDYSGSFSIPQSYSSSLQTMKCNGDLSYSATGGDQSAVVTHKDNSAKLSPINIIWNAPEDKDNSMIQLLSIGSIKSDWYINKLLLSANHKYHGQECPKPITPAADVCGGNNNNTNNNNNGDINNGINTDTGSHDHMSMGHVMSGAMFSYFTTDQYKSQSIIFESWYLGNGHHYAATVICFFLLSLLSEFFSALQLKLERYWNQNYQINKNKNREQLKSVIINTNNNNNNNDNNNNNSNNNANNNNNEDDEYTLSQHSIRTFLYCIRSFLSMILMIAFMSMDVGFFIAVLVGYTMGYFFFGRGKKKIMMNNNNDNNNKYGETMDIEGGKAGCH